MVSIELATQLRNAGIVWEPREGDCFVVPEPQLEGQLFYISRLPALIQSYKGSPVATFHGTAEWALDYVLLSEVVWLPNETQLRELLGAVAGHGALLRLERTAGGYRCDVTIGQAERAFEAGDASMAYALALLEALGEG
jgi:hypothetical protein